MITPHLTDGRWELAIPNYAYAWVWTWNGRTNEPTVRVEGLTKPVGPPPAEVGPPAHDPNFPGTVPWNL